MFFHLKVYFCSHSLAWHGFALSGFARFVNFLPRCFLASFGCEPGWQGKLVEESSKEPGRQLNQTQSESEIELFFVIFYCRGVGLVQE